MTSFFWIGVSRCAISGLLRDLAQDENLVEEILPGSCRRFYVRFRLGYRRGKCMQNPEVTSNRILQIHQSVSALIYGMVPLPILKGWDLTISVFTPNHISTFFVIAIAALCATVSYLLYYRAIGKIGVAKAMGLNITYAILAMVFSVLLFQDYCCLSPLTVAVPQLLLFAACSRQPTSNNSFPKHKKVSRQ